jgi:hypothetical protein
MTDMWLVICKEYNEGEVHHSLNPWNSLSARRMIMLVYNDGGEAKGGGEFPLIK